MIQALANSPELAVLDRVIAFTEARHEVLADNVANIDTPGYRMRDLDLQAFQKDLRTLCRKGPTDSAQSVSPQSQVDTDQYLLFHDDNNRSVERQMTAITRNAILHNVAVELLRTQYQILQKAASLRL